MLQAGVYKEQSMQMEAAIMSGPGNQRPNAEEPLQQMSMQAGTDKACQIRMVSQCNKHVIEH